MLENKFVRFLLTLVSGFILLFFVASIQEPTVQTSLSMTVLMVYLIVLLFELSFDLFENVISLASIFHFLLLGVAILSGLLGLVLFFGNTEGTVVFNAMPTLSAIVFFYVVVLHEKKQWERKMFVFFPLIILGISGALSIVVSLLGELSWLAFIAIIVISLIVLKKIDDKEMRKIKPKSAKSSSSSYSYSGSSDYMGPMKKAMDEVARSNSQYYRLNYGHTMQVSVTAYTYGYNIDFEIAVKLYTGTDVLTPQIMKDINEQIEVRLSVTRSNLLEQANNKINNLRSKYRGLTQSITINAKVTDIS